LQRDNYHPKEIKKLRVKGGCCYALIENTKIFFEVSEDIASFMKIID
jgi:hypothetical protein